MNREQLQNIHREILLALGTVNDIEETTSRLRNELMEMDNKVVEKLDTAEDG